MNKTLLSLLLICFCTANVFAVEPTERSQWIWIEQDRQPGVAGFLRRQIDIPFPVTSAVLRIVGESVDSKVFLDGVPIGEIEPYDGVWKLDVTDQVRVGKQVLAIEVLSCNGPAALAVRLDLRFDERPARAVVSDESWLVAKTRLKDWRTAVFKTEAPGWSPAVSFGAVGAIFVPPQRQVGVKPIDNYEQWRQALNGKGSDPASFLTTPGFEIELVRSAAAGEDSWVSMAFGPKGRVVIAKEKKGLLRMTLSQGGDRVTGVTVIDDALKECRGLLFAKDDLFVNANNSKGLYRLRSDGGDSFKEPELLYASSGGVGHGRNDLALGPDGRIYMIHGDSVQLPKKSVDYTSPFRRFARQAGEGHLLRIAPEGGEVEVLAAGLRNPFGIDFNRDGELFTYDADAEFDMGAPWYRPTRVNHLVMGGDYGWRAVTKSWPPYYTNHADNALPNLDIGKGSPTAVKFGDRSNFPSKYKRALFILDWAYGRILAVHVRPRGGSYLMAAESFLQGRPLNVTDLDFGPDGSMYLVTGGRGTQSALYRVRYVGSKQPAPTQTSQQRASQEFAKRRRAARRGLEAMLLESDRTDEELTQVGDQLGSKDPWIRHAARNVLERTPIERWLPRAFEEREPMIAASLLLAAARSGDRDLPSRILDRLNQIDWSRTSGSARWTALYAYWRCLSTDTPEEFRVQCGERLNALYPSSAYRENRLLSELLARCGHEELIGKTLALMQATERQAEQFHYLFALRNVNRGWTIEQRRRYFSSMAETRHYVGGAGMAGFLKQIREQATATLNDQERRELGELLKARSADVVEETSPREFVRKWTIEALEGDLTPGDSRDLQRGEELFKAASCIKCHRMAGRGALIGPDLTAVGRRFGLRALLESVIEPSKVVAEKYRSLQIRTKDGRQLVGQVGLGGDYRSPVLRLATDPQQPFEIKTIPKADIEEQEFSRISWMPKGLLDTLSREEILDLMAYLAAGQTSERPGGPVGN